MGWRQFYSKWLQKTFSKPFLIAEIVAFILSIIGGFISWRWPEWAGAMSFLLWTIPVGVLIVAVLVGFFLAPYWIYKEDERKARHFDAKTIMLPKRPKYSRERLEQVKQWLNENIEEGEGLSREMQTRSFNWAQLELWVHRWVQSIARDINEIIPEYSDYILAELGSITAEERLLYNGWRLKRLHYVLQWIDI